MSNASTLSFSSKSGTSLFTADEVRQLMRVEFERAKRYTYPIACIMVQVDRLEQIATVHGHESKEEILRSVVDLVRRATRAGDLLGYLVEDRLLALFPHTNAVSVGFLCKRLLEGARQLQFATGAGTIRITLSVGISHNEHPGAISFETLERVAEEGVAVADAAGGDRSVETELYQLYEQQALHATLDETLEDDGYRTRLENLVAEEGDFERAVAQIAEEIAARVLSEGQQEHELAQVDPPAALPGQEGLASDEASEYQREIDKLQRRVAKLTKSLGLTETELGRLRKVKNVDDGLSSIYRDVQGLGDEDLHSVLKKELMAKIFEANLDLRKGTEGAA
ncbi:MAG: diguanylate cyclase [bacterium]|nr:diguanylate cyclase [bacterium]